MIATLLCLLLAVVSASAETSMPWNQLASSLWPSQSPWQSWISPSFVLKKPWSDTKCFHAWLDGAGDLTSSPIKFVPKVDCPLCNNTVSAPGFAPDPNDCQAFYMCIPYANGAVWSGRRMTCAKCQFWDQKRLTCVPVQSGPECLSDTAVYNGPVAEPQTPADEKRSITCVTFDEANNALATNGLWVVNTNVKVVDHPGVCKHGKCGYFPGNGTVEIPFFVNNYQNYKKFSISLFYALTAGASYQGILSNSDCLNGADKDDSSSIYISSPSQNLFNAGLKAADGSAADAKFQWSWDLEWHHIAVVWDGQKVTFYNDKQEVKVLDFLGPILNTKCPMVLGSFLCPKGPCYFTGVMDQVCFYKSALSAQEVFNIADNPETIY